MKLELLSKLDKKNLKTSKKFDNDFVSENYDVIVIFQIYGPFPTDAWCNFCSFSSITPFYLTKLKTKVKLL